MAYMITEDFLLMTKYGVVRSLSLESQDGVSQSFRRCDPGMIDSGRQVSLACDGDQQSEMMHTHSSSPLLGLSRASLDIVSMTDQKSEPQWLTCTMRPRMHNVFELWSVVDYYY